MENAKCLIIWTATSYTLQTVMQSLLFKRYNGYTKDVNTSESRGKQSSSEENLKDLANNQGQGEPRGMQLTFVGFKKYYRKPMKLCALDHF